MLDRDLALLAAADPDVSLTGVEQAVWSKIDAIDRLQRIARMTTRVQTLALGAGLIASTALGVAAAQPSRSHNAVMQISSVAADLAPSTLLGPRR